MFHLNALGVMVLFFVTFSGSEAADVEINVTEKNCSRIEKHFARDDVTYKPGVDVRGKPVAPADLNDSRIKLPDNITIDLSLPLKDLYAGDRVTNGTLQGAEVQIGKLEYSISSGKIKFNGQELADPALHAIALKCREIYFKPKS